jgi:small-conductance mechanosensitive channel
VRKLRDASIEIPFPQRDIHIRTAPGNPAGQAQDITKVK